MRKASFTYICESFGNIKEQLPSRASLMHVGCFIKEQQTFLLLTFYKYVSVSLLLECSRCTQVFLYIINSDRHNGLMKKPLRTDFLMIDQRETVAY